MAIPTFQLSRNSSLAGHAQDTNSIVSITSMITGDYVDFLAFLTDASQTLSLNWNTEEVFGRNDPIAVYQGTKRSISVSFSVPSENLEDAKNNLIKVDILTAFMYPAYRNYKSLKEVENLKVSSYMAAPPLIKLKFANLINNNENGGAFASRRLGSSKGENTKVKQKTELEKAEELTTEGGGAPESTLGATEISNENDGLLGYADSISINPVLDHGTFTDPQLLTHYPKLFEISFSFNVLHQNTLGWDEDTGTWLGDRFIFGTEKE